MKILIADDENLVRASLARVLRTRGHEVLEASNGTDALRIFKEQALDLAVLDVLMPGMSGFQVAAEIRGSSRMPIILMSAHAHPEEFGPSGQFHDAKFIRKPFNDIFETTKEIEDEGCRPHG